MKKLVKLITEQSYDIELIEESSKNMYVVGIFSTALVENANSRKYPKNILEREVDKYIKEKIKNKCAYGELNHPTSPQINLDKAAIIVEHLEWKGNNIFGKAKILSTPNGEILKSIIKDGGKVGISSRGLGTVSDEGWVNEDFSLVTYDIVGSPSNSGSWLNGIYEGKNFYLPYDKEDNINLIESAKKEYTEKLLKFFHKVEKNL